MLVSSLRRRPEMQQAETNTDPESATKEQGH